LVTALNGVVGLVSKLPPQVTELVGSFTAASMIAGKFGIDAGKGFEGLGGKIKTVAKTGKGFGDVLAGLASGAVNPATLAVAGLGIGLQILGKKQEEAAAAAAAHAEAERNMAQAIRE